MYALRDVLNMYNIEYPEFEYFCSLRISRYIIKDVYNYSLETLLNHLKIDTSVHHRAGADAYGCAIVMLECLNRSGLSIDDLENMFSFKRGKFSEDTFIPQHSTIHSNYNEFIKNIVVNESQISEDNYFYKKTVCFTGTCESGQRKELLQKIANVGGIPTNSVTKKTDVLVVGQQDFRIVGEDGMSTKQEKAFNLRSNGFNIEIISEREFLRLMA
jgi:DNA polymerase-3 subunit epsilon